MAAVGLSGCAVFLDQSDPGDLGCDEPALPPGVMSAIGFEAECFEDKRQNDPSFDWVAETDLFGTSGEATLRAVSTGALDRNCATEEIATCGASLDFAIELEPGDYIVHVRANAPRDTANSIWIEVDGGPREVFFMRNPSPGLQWWYDDFVLAATSAVTTLTVSIRELDVSLDALALEPVL